MLPRVWSGKYHYDNGKSHAAALRSTLGLLDVIEQHRGTTPRIVDHVTVCYTFMSPPVGCQHGIAPQKLPVVRGGKGVLVWLNRFFQRGKDLFHNLTSGLMTTSRLGFERL